jgi:hypothetical protein
MCGSRPRQLRLRSNKNMNEYLILPKKKKVSCFLLYSKKCLQNCELIEIILNYFIRFIIFSFKSCHNFSLYSSFKKLIVITLFLITYYIIEVIHQLL